MEEIREIIEAIKALNQLTFNNQRRTLVFPIEGNETGKLNELNIDFSKDTESSFEIDITNLGFDFFYSESDFLTRVGSANFNNSVYLYEENVFYNCENSETYIHFKRSEANHLLTNNHYYFKLLAFLKSKEHKENAIFYFVDYFSYDSRLIVFTSLKKEGQLNILIPSNGINVSENVGLKEAYIRFIDAFKDENRHFPKFIKNEIVVSLAKEQREDRMVGLIRKLPEILNIAEQNFEIYLHDLSLENLRRDFLEHKNKYFQQLREILSKLTNQIVALPIAISASIFATYKIENSIITLLLVLMVFVIYTTYSLYLVNLQKCDIKDIKKNFLLDFDVIKNSEYFKKFSSELDRFENTKNGLQSRIGKIMYAFDLYYFVFSLSSILFIVYIEFQISLSLFWMILSSSILFVFSILSFFLMNRASV